MDAFVVIDLEATCNNVDPIPQPQELIELAAVVDREGDGGRRLESRDATTKASTSAVDLVVETRGSASLRLGEAHRVGERDRGDGIVSIVGFVDRVDAPSATLATESQTIMFFGRSNWF